MDEAVNRTVLSNGPLLFGAPGRELFGLLHAQPGHDPARAAMLVCAPLLQEGIRAHRALWAVAESVAAAGAPSLCFDWHGSGDSAGEDDELSMSGMRCDLDDARRTLSARGGDRITWLALRSAALPMLSYLCGGDEAVDVVLWEPQLVGASVVSSWRRQHHAQLYESGRYAHARHEPDADDLLGFRVDPRLLAELAAIDAAALPLPRGSRVRLATWQRDDDTDRFIRTQNDNAVEVDVLELDGSDRPGWEDPRQFGSQVYPRRSGARLAQWLTATVAR